MTKLELNQPRQVFFNAGRIAYRMGIFMGDNPYPKTNPAFDAWNDGYSKARALAERSGGRFVKPLPNKPRGKHMPRSK